MKRFLLTLCALAVLAGSAQASIVSRLGNAQPSDLFLEDDSRELLIDVDQSGSLSPGDVLLGYAKIAQTSPPAASANNDIYAVFSQTFDPVTFNAQAAFGGTRYSGGFLPTPNIGNGYSLQELLAGNNAVNPISANALLAFVDVAGPAVFSQDLATVSLPGLGNVDGAIASILDGEGTVQFTAGLSEAADFFQFETVPLGGVGQPADFVLNPAATQTISTSTQLGNFGAGLSVIDNFIPLATFNQTIISLFPQNNTGINWGQGNLYDLSVVNGNFGGIFDGVGLQQGGGLSFVNNADVVVNATVVPEPGTLLLWGVMCGLGLIGGLLRRRFA